jgi:Protein of unknown function (DUF1269)
LIGLIFFVPLFGAAIGAAAGAAGGALSDTGVDDDFMKQLGEELQPGNAALIVLVQKVSADKVLPQIKVPGTVIQTSLSKRTSRGSNRRSTPRAPNPHRWAPRKSPLRAFQGGLGGRGDALELLLDDFCLSAHALALEQRAEFRHVRLGRVADLTDQRVDPGAEDVPDDQDEKHVPRDRPLQ